MRSTTRDIIMPRKTKRRLSLNQNVSDAIPYSKVRVEWWDRLFHVLPVHFPHTLTLEGHRPRQQLIKDYPQRVDVRPAVHPPTGPLLRGHVKRRPHHPGTGHGGRLHRSGYTEVSHLHGPVFGKQYVLGFYIPVYYVLTVGMG